MTDLSVQNVSNLYISNVDYKTGEERGYEVISFFFCGDGNSNGLTSFQGAFINVQGFLYFYYELNM